MGKSNLMGLPNWCERGDAFFDVAGFVILLEDATELSLRDAEVERLPNVDSYDELQVRYFVLKAVELLVGKTTPGDR